MMLASEFSHTDFAIEQDHSNLLAWLATRSTGGSPWQGEIRHARWKQRE